MDYFFILHRFSYFYDKFSFSDHITQFDSNNINEHTISNFIYSIGRANEPIFFYVSNTKINRLVYFIQLAKRESTSVRVCKVGFNLLKRGF